MKLKNVAQLLCVTALGFMVVGCQMGYLAKSSYYQLALLAKKERLEYALRDPDIDAETKRKILLVQEVKKFAEAKIGLVHTRNYDSFVLLDDKYVTYVVTASPPDRLEAFEWSFPIVGRVPYKGFFKKKDAELEKTELEKKNLDVAIRGVGAYSTLGWFADPLLSSMTAYEDAELVETIIHETTHATLYIKSNADFNERLAMFVGSKGMEEFYQQKEGPSSKAIERAHLLAQDAKTFGDFISEELHNLEDFYKKNQGSKSIGEDRQNAFAQIRKNFTLRCRPRLKTDSYEYFPKMKFNNAVLLGYKTYYQDLDIFEKAYVKLGSNWSTFFEFFKKLKSSDQPEKEVRDLISFGPSP